MHAVGLDPGGPAEQAGRAQASLTDMLAGVTLFPQTLLNVRLTGQTDWKKNERLAAEIRTVEHELVGQGRVLIRPSGTEPVLRVMVEGEPRELIESAAQSIATAVKQAAAI